ncbi:MAG: DUF4391 domain-containing protein [Fermentimonas sp.]|nr:DUF4391 domain-containing protein [Fermentimonas sp.]
MIQFPESTYIGKRIPKEGFYNKLEMNVSLKRAFVEDIDQIIWRNLLSEATLNVSKGEKVSQIDIIQINLKRKDYNKSILHAIEKAIPRHLLFILKYDNQFLLYINYKEEYQKEKFKIVESYSAEWCSEQEISLTLTGLDLDKVYENFVYQLANGKIIKTEVVELKQSIQQVQEIEKIKKKIVELETKMRNEKQFNIQLRISNEIKELKNKLLNI